MISKACIKFNSGHGALLCNQCSKILKTGFDHEDKLHFCDWMCRNEYFHKLYGNPQHQYND